MWNIPNMAESLTTGAPTRTMFQVVLGLKGEVD